jgi:hypothetical protein
LFIVQNKIFLKQTLHLLGRVVKLRTGWVLRWRKQEKAGFLDGENKKSIQNFGGEPLAKQVVLKLNRIMEDVLKWILRIYLLVVRM